MDLEDHGKREDVRQAAATGSPQAVSGTAAATNTSMATATTKPASSAKPYISQFSAATQMILNRMKGETNSLSAAVLPKPSVTPAAYLEARNHVISKMSTTVGTSMTMQMPTTLPAAPITTSTTVISATPHRTAGMSAIRKVTSGLTGKPKPKPPTVESVKPPKKTKLAVLARAPVMKRKRGLDGEGSSVSSSDSEDSKSNSTPTTTTKSGRQVLKPTTYNPAAMDLATKKRVHYGKRTPGEALCKKCTRLVSPQYNQIVFCDGCEGAWHQLCHAPEIDDSVVEDANSKWFCTECSARRGKHIVHKKPKVEIMVSNGNSSNNDNHNSDSTRGGWVARTPGQKRAYLLGLTHVELVDLLMQASEKYPNLPIFPPEERSSPAGSASFSTAFAKSDLGILKANPVPNVPCTIIDPEEDDPYGLMEAWPKPGYGMYYGLLFRRGGDDDYMVDNDDYEAFSHTLYDKKGRKLRENGVVIMPN